MRRWAGGGGVGGCPGGCGSVRCKNALLSCPVLSCPVLRLQLLVPIITFFPARLPALPPFLLCLPQFEEMYEQRRREVNKEFEKYQKQIKVAKKSGSKAAADKVRSGAPGRQAVFRGQEDWVGARSGAPML